MLDGLSATDQQRLLAAMQTIETILGEPTPTRAPYLLRAQQPGDMGWVIHRHGALYAQAYGWDERFEALVAEIVAKFIHHFDPRWERCWLAEMNGDVVGSVFLVKQSEEVAKLATMSRSSTRACRPRSSTPSPAEDAARNRGRARG